MGYLVTCEHGSDLVPSSLARYFDAQESDGRFVCANGFDVGARQVARHFANRLGCPAVEAKFSPTVIDCNRPMNHRLLFSPLARKLPLSDRQGLVRDVHSVHQSRVRALIDHQQRCGEQTIHLAIHSFAPFEPGKGLDKDSRRCDSARRTDLGLLYDPSRALERELCAHWYETLFERVPMIRVRRNYPMRGTREGLTQSLRREYPADSYLGIELQMNQAWCARELSISRHVLDGIIDSLTELCGLDQSFAA
jgi:predicted N-formylglutamate amidohydrolase